MHLGRSVKLQINPGAQMDGQRRYDLMLRGGRRGQRQEYEEKMKGREKRKITEENQKLRWKQKDKSRRQRDTEDRK